MCVLCIFIKCIRHNNSNRKKGENFYFLLLIFRSVVYNFAIQMKLHIFDGARKKLEIFIICFENWFIDYVKRTSYFFDLSTCV